MSDLEQRIRDALKAEQAVRDEAASVSYETRRDVMARMKRNDRLTFSTAGVLAAAAVAAVFFVTGGGLTGGAEKSEERIAPAATGSPTPEESPSPEESPPGPATVEASPGDDAGTAEPDDSRKGGSLVRFAIWPETTRESAALACEEGSMWRPLPRAVVSRFATEVLRLQSPIIRRIEGRDFYAVSAGSGSTPTQVQVGEFGGADCWSVTSVSAPDVADVMSYEIHNGRFEVVFDRHLSAIDIHVAWGGSGWTAGTENADRVTVDLHKRFPGEQGSWITVLKGSDGEILGAWGGIFPEGDSAAG